jgi:RimJ/RimL family protein N-acetyltransferase
MTVLGPEVDAEPRALPDALPFRGHYVTLEPADAVHRAGLWKMQQATPPDAYENSFSYIPYGPFQTEPQFNHWFGGFAAREDQKVWVIKPEQMTPAGWLTLLDIKPQYGTLELGRIWLAPVMQHTRAATEAFYLILYYAFSTLGYRRVTWKCDALNAPGRRAALRLGFSFEGILRNHMIIKGRSRDSAYFGMVSGDWPRIARGFEMWLAAENFAADGRQLAPLAAMREAVRF